MFDNYENSHSGQCDREEHESDRNEQTNQTPEHRRLSIGSGSRSAFSRVNRVPLVQRVQENIHQHTSSESSVDGTNNNHSHNQNHTQQNEDIDDDGGSANSYEHEQDLPHAYPVNEYETDADNNVIAADIIWVLQSDPQNHTTSNIHGRSNDNNHQNSSNKATKLFFVLLLGSIVVFMTIVNSLSDPEEDEYNDDKSTYPSLSPTVTDILVSIHPSVHPSMMTGKKY